MKKNRRGFTLAEVLICMVILGVIMAISVGTLKVIRASYTSLAYFEYKNIQRMAGEMIAGLTPNSIKSEFDGDDQNKALITTKMKRATAGNYINVITDDNTVFCKAIASLANTVGEVQCDSFFSVTNETSSMTNQSEPMLNINEDDDTYKNPNFVSNSGRRYYISEWQEEGNVSEDYGYRLIGVDLNGTQKPNISLNNTRKVPDIAVFMILDNGEIFPMGVTADNINMPDGRVVLYLNSKVKGYYFKYDPTREGTVPKECKMKLTYKDANKNDVLTDQVQCNFGVVYAPNENTPGKDGKQNFFFSYREAYCSALGERTSAYANYCNSISGQSLCPPSSNEKQFDLCKVDNVKPVFRYNF